MKHTRQIILLAFAALSECCSASAQPLKVWQDTPTPDEITVHNQPYIILQNEIEKNLCNNDWDFSINDSRGKSATPFLILKGGPGEDVILRGTTVHYFSPVDRGNVAEVQMKPNSPLYIANRDSTNAQMKILEGNIVLADAITARAAKNHYQYTDADKTTMDKIKASNNNPNLEMARLLDVSKWAIITLQLNADYTEDFKDANYNYNFYAGSKLSTVPAGIKMATLFKQNNDKDSKDTLYYAVLYIGNWPDMVSIKKREFFHFVNYTKAPWIDKQHSGIPVLENMKITIKAFNYEKLMKVINGFDWTKLKALIK